VVVLTSAQVATVVAAVHRLAAFTDTPDGANPPADLGLRGKYRTV
jgi:hypothetical protein